LPTKYRHAPLSFDGLQTIPIADRGGKVTTAHMAKPYERGSGLQGLFASLPDILAAPQLQAVIDAILVAREKGRGILWGMGGHVIKCGLAPVLADLMRRGFVTGFVMNGAATIHDFEIGIAGQSSEDVEAVLPDGRFGAAEETGREMNDAIAAGVAEGLGMGEALGKRLTALTPPEYAPYCLQVQAYNAGIPVTVHVAVGTDTPHTHPRVDAAAIGTATHSDFRLFCSLVRELDNGGIYLNLGSAVILPEVFLKAVSVVRNLGFPLGRFTTANFDFLQHYRPKMNVVDRPHARRDGKGYSITGHHEIMIPLLAAALIERTPS
jgi:hypothetical protein